MAQDEHTSRCSNSSSGGGGGGGAGGGSGGGGGGSSHRSSKKLKHKKVPQRGMGVAQLEKIISEEQQKKDATVLTPNLASKVPNFRLPPPPPPPISSSSIPPPPPLPINHHHLISTKSNAFPPTNISGGGGGGGGSGGGSNGGGGGWCRLLNDDDYNFEIDKQNQNQNHGMDHPRYPATGFSSNLGGLPYDSNLPIWLPTPNLMLQRSPNSHQPSSSSMLNMSVGTTSSSVTNFQIEPPSNQSYCGNNFQPLWPEEEKMVGMKRPYPFSLENVPIPSFHCKFPAAYVSPISRLDESASCSNGGGPTSIDPAYPSLRENAPSLGVIPDTITKKFIDENQGLTRDFLKLAPSQASGLNSGPKDKLLISHCIGEQTQFEILPPRNGESSNPQPFHSFFPVAKVPVGQAGNSNGEAGESVDLNLKL